MLINSSLSTILHYMYGACTYGACRLQYPLCNLCISPKCKELSNSVEGMNPYINYILNKLFIYIKIKVFLLYTELQSRIIDKEILQNLVYTRSIILSWRFFNAILWTRCNSPMSEIRQCLKLRLRNLSLI